MNAEYWANKIYEAAGMVVNDDQAFGIGNMVEACIAEVKAERDRFREALDGVMNSHGEQLHDAFAVARAALEESRA